MKNITILVGAGKGKRIGDKDKTFLVINGKPLLSYSLLSFEKCKLIDEIILVVKKNEVEHAKKIIDKYKFKKVQKIISGGKTRQDSVYNGLSEINNANIVLVHDIARPLITKNIIKYCIKNAKKFGAVIPVISIKDTIKSGNKFIKKTVNRNNLFLAQTPQAFKYQILKDAYESAKKSKFYGTDDASLVEKLGHEIKMISGSPKNIKITVPEDMIITESLLKKENQDKIEIKAYAKINLDLKVLDKLPNGYHRIKSIFQTVNLYDTLIISKNKKEFGLTGSIVCLPDLNLVTKAKNTLEKYVKRKLPCKIHLIKAIPISAGLGGGSSDSAATIIGLNELYDLRLSLKELKKIALEIGSDVPFFISGFGRALVEGIGEKIKPLNMKVPKIYILARPHKRISTSKMYEEYDKTKKSFFELANAACPAIAKIFNYFSKTSNKCGMSGSGPTIFAEFSSYDKAIRATENLDIKKFDGDLFICKPVTKTYELL